MSARKIKEKLKAGIIVHLTADALGVPVEFKSREELKKDPVQKMRGYGTYYQPPGTWSDDSSLTLCLLESLINGYDLQDQADKFVSWLYDAYWTARGRTFDVGNSTRESISRLKAGQSPTRAGAGGERDNGNGALMRILPLAFYLLDADNEERFNKTKEVTSLTHSHPRSILGCYIYIDFAIRIIEGAELKNAYQETVEHLKDFIQDEAYKKELKYYKRILAGNIKYYNENEIKSTGYVVDTLEAAFWVLLNTDSYSYAVLKAVNLGEDTDTVAAVTGGLAGIHYGYSDIPAEWLRKLARLDEVLELIDEFSEKRLGS
ncbi:ADP-ribosylglycohydrolase family protein [Halanaerobium hydrogeniformans]|uniref:ADP-ribosylation/Crystallin J1 n=1 Tax=Halanaerobium hydrogeniformans TaxID=656519 RepID=E4RIY4_HALHG|nr:ADP-ribosylglycohydrolase family protein [Halanaerobium hydrogeniformans]ADQ15204.1 ADP-ribosylation/Crystallin J1 [Halanaerobium hydrogeniformans]